MRFSLAAKKKKKMFNLDDITNENYKKHEKWPYISITSAEF